MGKMEEKNEIVLKIEFIVVKIIEALKEKSLFHPIDCFGRNRKSRKSIYFGNEDESKDLEVNPTSERGMALLVVSLSVLRLRREKQTISKRALFYLYPGLFETQAIIDYAIDFLAFLTDCNRPTLCIFQATKGEGYGHLIIQTSPNSHEEKKFFDFSIDGGNTIPVDLDDCEITQAPKWILVVEKYAVYERLMKCKYGIDDGGLVLTGRGVPDRATRNLLSVLSSRIPAYCLVDPDPCGFDIYVSISNWFISNGSRRRFSFTQSEIIWCFTFTIQRTRISRRSST